MKCALLFALVAAAMPLGACAGRSELATAPPAPVDVTQNAIAADLVNKVVLEGHRSLTLAALGYDSAAKVAIAGVQTGLIRGTQLDQLRELNRDATAALAFGYSATSAAEKARAAVTLDAIVRRIRALAPP